MSRPKLLRPEQLGEHYQLLMKLLVPSWPECLDEPVDPTQKEAKAVIEFPFPSNVLDPHITASVFPHPSPPSLNFGVAVDAWLTSSGKLYICDMAHLHRVAILHPDSATRPISQKFLRKNGQMAHFTRAGAVMAVDNEQKIVVKDMDGLHFFNATTDEFLYDSEHIEAPYGLAVLKDGSLATHSEKQKTLIVVGTDGKIIKEARLDPEIVQDIVTRNIVRPKDKVLVGARIRFMCSNVRRDGVEAIYLVDEAGQRMYAVNADDGKLIWKTTLNGQETDIGFPKGIAALPNGRLVVCLNRYQSLAVFDENGQFIHTIRTNPRVEKPTGLYLRQVGDKTTLLVTFGVKKCEGSVAVVEYEVPEAALRPNV